MVLSTKQKWVLAARAAVVGFGVAAGGVMGRKPWP